MTRSALREELFKLLFRVEFNDRDELEEQLKLFLEEEEKLSEDEKEELSLKFRTIVNDLDAIDTAINLNTQGWNTDRIGKAELTIIRIAVYEINMDDKVPAGAAINEAVELAKKYGDEGAYAFVNGVLSKFVKTDK